MRSHAATFAPVFVLLSLVAGAPGLAVSAPPAAQPAGKTQATATASVQVTAAAPAALPDYAPPAAYREDMVITADGKPIVMRRFYDGARIRTEFAAEGSDMILIELGDAKGTTYFLMPEEKKGFKQSRQAQEETAGKLEKEPAQPEPAVEAKIEDLGEEAVGGVPARKFKITYPDGTVLGWFEKADGAPLRMEGAVSGGSTVIEWKNRQVGEQPAELFRVPKGYDVTDMDEMMAQMQGMGGMMKGMMGGAAEGMGQNLGGSLGSALGGSLAGPLGAAAGQYLGGKVGGLVGRKAAGAVN